MADDPSTPNATSEKEWTKFTVRIPTSLVARISEIVSRRQEKSKPIPITQNTIVLQWLLRAVADAERER